MLYGYIKFSIIEVTPVIYNPDKLLGALEVQKEEKIQVLNLTPIPLEVLTGYIVCFITMAEKSSPEISLNI